MSTPSINDSVIILKPSVEPAFYKLELPGGNDELAKSALATLRQIEKQGGSAAFEAWLKETDNGRKKSPLPSHIERTLASSRPASFASGNSYDGVAVTIYSVGVYTYISVDVIGTGISGSGGAWGLGLGAMWGVGTLIIPQNQSIQAWSQRIEFFGIAAAASSVGGAEVEFYNPSGIAGQIWVAGGGLLGAIGFGGGFEFR